MDERKLCLLVVDDDEDDFILVQGMLRALADCDHAGSAPAALAALGRKPYDLLLLDYRLGGETGLDLLQKIKRTGAGAPVIFLTGHGDEEVAVEALKAGACDYLLKSRLTEAALSRAVQFAVRRHEDAVKLEAAHKALRDSEERFRALVENISDTIVVLDGAGTVRYANARGALGYGETENVGHSGFELLHPDDADKVRQLYLDCVRSPESTARAEFRVLHKDGSWRDVEATAVNHLRHPSVQGIIVSYHDVTERNRAEEAMRLSEQIVRHAGAVILVVNAKGHITYASDAVQSILGYEPAEVLGDGWWKKAFFDAKEAESVRLLLMSIADGGIPSPAEVFARKMRHKDGSFRWILWRDAKGPNDDVIGVGHDITRQKETESALQNANEQLSTLLGSLPVAVYRSDPTARRSLFVSRNVTAICGHAAEAFLEREGFWLENIHGDDLPAVKEVFSRVPECDSYNFEYRFRFADGTYHWMLDSARLVRPADGSPPYIVGTWLNIDDRKQADEALRESEARLRTLIERAPMAIGMAREGKVIYGNAKCAELFGRGSREELVGQTVADFYVPDDRAAAWQRAQQRAIAPGESVEFEARGCRNGTTFPLHGVVTIVELADGPASVAFLSDISERRRAEDALRLQSTALAAVANAILIADPEGQIVWVNPAFERLTGYTLGEAVGRTPRILNSGEQGASFYERLWKTILAGEVWQGELVNRRKDGTKYNEQMTITPMKTSNGVIRNFIAVKQDITEQRRLREQLMQAQKMEAVGRLSGGVAHDFNNILNVILGYSDLLSEKIPASDPLHRNVEQIHKAGQRAADLTRQLLAFSRQQVVQPANLNLNAVIADLEKMLHRLIGEDIAIRTVLEPELAGITADRSQIEQIVLNLAINARDAMPEGGHLTIETRNCVLDESYAASHDGVAPGAYVLLAVSDTGIGMTADTQSHIFEPFFTTKEQGRGTGLGLATVYGIVQQSSGHVWVYSEPGQGSTFKVYLPAVGRQPERVPRPEAKETCHGTETILLVEDSLPLRELTRDLLRDAGYMVLEAQDAAEALALVEKQGPFHLMITDVVMPGMSGPALAEKMRHLRPEIRVLYISGYTDHAMLHRGTVGEHSAFLQKPYTRQALCRKVREVLHAEAALMGVS